jgi:hypothetical protein
MGVLRLLRNLHRMTVAGLAGALLKTSVTLKIVVNPGNRVILVPVRTWPVRSSWSQHSGSASFFRNQQACSTRRALITPVGHSLFRRRRWPWLLISALPGSTRRRCAHRCSAGFSSGPPVSAVMATRSEISGAARSPGVLAPNVVPFAWYSCVTCWATSRVYRESGRRPCGHLAFFWSKQFCAGDL